MIESLLILATLASVATATALFMDRLDRERVLSETKAARDELKDLIAKLGASHNDLILNIKDVNSKINSMDLRITAVAAATASNGPQPFRGAR